MDDTITGDALAVSRRDLLRRSALVGGAMIWVAPAVQTLATPAFAAGSTPSENQCLFRFFLKFTPAPDSSKGESYFDNSEGVGNSTCVPSIAFEHPMLSGISQSPGGSYDVTLKRENGTQLGAASVTYNSTTGCVTLSVTGFSIDGSSSYYFIKDGMDKIPDPDNPNKNINDPADSGNGCEIADTGTFTDSEAADGTVTRCDNADDRANLSHINWVLCVTSNP